MMRLDKNHAVFHVSEPILPADFPRVITLCGSTRFEKEFMAEQQRLTFAGNIVLSVGCFDHQIGLDMSGEMKSKLDELHLRKIDMSDEVHVINAVTQICTACLKPCRTENRFSTEHGYIDASACCVAFVRMKPYIGESTRREIEYARTNGIPITYLNPLEE